MTKNEIDTQTLTRRTLLLAGGGGSCFGVLTSRLYYLQVMRSEDYQVLSDKNRFNFNMLIPSRGRILDRHGEALAINRQNYRVLMLPEQVKDMSVTLNMIGETITLRGKTRKRILKDVKEHASFIPVLIDENLDWNTFASINLRTPDIAGVIPEVGEKRAYPNKGVFAHVLGYVGRANRRDIDKDDDPLLRQPTFRIGKTGVEASVDKLLRGQSGKLKVEVNSVGRIVREWPEDKDRAQHGTDVSLTLDADLQRYAAKLFKDDSGGAVVIDTLTGELRALLSMPTFDGNLFVSGLTREDMVRMNADEKRPQFNKVIGGGYPPASTFKMVVMLAALKAGRIDPREKIYCAGKLRLGNRNFHCWKRKGHGAMSMRDGLKNSCDVYFYDLADRVGIEAIAEMALKLGLGQKFDFGVAGQTRGIVPNPEWKRRRLNQNWHTGDTYNAAIGQGFVLSSPLQLAVMAARLANGRRSVNPYLIINDNLPDFEDLDIDPVHLAIVQEAMWAVCEEPGGTGYKPDDWHLEGIAMAGKTGTGQVRGISSSERRSGVVRNQSLPWKLRDHSIFVGYAPYAAPRFATSVIIEHGGSGSKRAASIARALLQRALERDGLANRATDGPSENPDIPSGPASQRTQTPPGRRL